MPEPQVNFELTNRCQLDCLHCLVADRDRTKSLPVDLYEDILRQVSSFGIRRMAFTGGEPTLHPQFANILDIACQRDFKFSMVTNGWNFSDILPILHQYRQGLVAVNFSLDGAREETHDNLRAAGSYRRVLDAMDLCRTEEIPFNVKMVLTSRSYTEVEEMCDLALEKGVAALVFGECTPTIGSAQHGLDLPPEKYVEIGAYINDELVPKYSPRLYPRTFLGAHAPTRWMVCEALAMRLFSIDAEGHQILCTTLSANASCPPGPERVADLRQVSFQEALRRLIPVSGRFHMDRVEAIEKGRVSDRDATFPCWYCQKYFNKTAWLKQFPDNPWNEWNGTSP